MKLKRKHVLIAAIFAIICIMIIANILIKKYSKDTLEIARREDEVVIEFSEVCYDNGWSKQHVAEIKDNIPIPTGYEYVQGDIETGFVIKDETENYYMWIPYNEEAHIDNIEEYFPESDEIEIDYDATMSMIEHNGFFASLTTKENGIDKLKEYDNEQYKTEKKEIEERNIEGDSVNRHLISKRELEQVLYYIQNKNYFSILRFSFESVLQFTKTADYIKLTTAEIHFFLEKI